MAGACSTLSTTVDFDHSADFSRYRSYTWKDTGEIADSIWDRRVESVLEDTVAARGLKKVDREGDLLMVVHARFSVETQVTTWNSGWGYGWGWGPTTTQVTQIPLGTMIVDLVDAKNNQLVWRGIANDTLQPDKQPEEREKKLRTVMAGLFADYPPAPK